MSPSPADVDAFYTQLQRRLLESGEWYRIQSILSSKLNESGWSDDIRHRTKERARVMEPLSFQSLFDEFAPHAQTSLPLAVRREVMSLIRQYLEKQFV
ncbi:Transcription and mRNA export factor SUS1 [Hypsizygus marmoreus]|uniref:Transcription and mRNA export factor SUS1 n=1 Tax=Hypsizygus marmoreus TaxID=39966 RepID=A0A369JKL7_HYPMA|nr:Transcription and mRNA export factor SUS1 [Hypsizygus marmoreus]